MHTLSLILLILLALAGYSAGAAAKAGRRFDHRPQLVDLALIIIIWAAALWARASWHTGAWRLIAIWVIIAGLAGYLASSLRKLPGLPRAALGGGAATPPPSSAAKRAWRAWTGFSKRMGAFQSRLLLSFFFFVFVTPFALAVKALADPLTIKRAPSARDSYWLPKKEVNVRGDDYRRQF